MTKPIVAGRDFVSTVAELAAQVVAERFWGIRKLFLDAGARPPVLVWNPTRSSVREPRLVAMLERWHALAGPAGAPLATAFGLDQLGAFADYATLVDIHSDERDFSYRHYGRALARHYGRDITGLRTSAIDDYIALFSGALYRAVMLRREPLFSVHEPPSFVLVRSWARVTTPLVDHDGRVVQLLVGSVPEDPIRAIVDTVIDGMLMLDQDGLIRVVNPALTALLGYASAEFLGHSLDQFLRWADGSTAASIPRHLIGTVSEAVATRRDGTKFPVEVSIGETSHGEGQLYAAVLRDITERKATEAEMVRLAYHDILTGVGNRMLLGDRLAEAVARAKRECERLALLLIDLDDFKLVNDTHGHAVGDKVLVGFAQRVGTMVRNTDLLARLGGDEFAVLLTALRRPDGAFTFASRMLGRLLPPIEVEGMSFCLQASIGLAIWPDAGLTPDELMRRADEALYAAKRRGGHCYVAYGIEEAVLRPARPTA